MQADNPSQVNPKEETTANGYDYSANAHLGDLPDYLHSIIVVPLTANEAKDPHNFSKIPYVLTYREDTTTIAQLINELKKMGVQFGDHNVYLTYRSGDRITENKSMRDIAKELRQTSIETLNLFLEKQQKIIKFSNIKPSDGSSSEENEEDTDSYVDECCVTEYKEDEIYEFGEKLLYNIWVEIPRAGNKVEKFQMIVCPDVKGEVLMENLFKAVNMNYNVQLQEKMVKKLMIKESKHQVKLDQYILPQTIYHNSELILELNPEEISPEFIFKRISNKNYQSNLIVYKEGKIQPLAYKYSEISELTFQEFYKTKLELQESKMKKDVIYGLKIMDVIIKPDECLSKADIYFNSQNPINIVGVVITDKMVFYRMIPELAEKKEFSLDELNVPPNQKDKRKQCRELSILRAEKTTNQYFKIKEHLEPILVYTAQLKYQDASGNAYVIYESLNRFLRTTPILTLDEGIINQEWRYRYASTLLKHLQKIPPYKGIVYRGISYDPKIENQGEIVTFKQFLSTSRKIGPAKTFLAKSNTGNKRHMFKLQVKEGYPIKDFSEYVGQQEILIPPFCDFKVVKIEQGKQGSYTLMTYHLSEIETSRQLPPVMANFIVWIDDNPREGKLIYDAIKIPSQTTLLVQILSTEDLKKWLKTHEKLFTDKTANLIFISDLTRKEGQIWNPIAGIQGLRQIRRYDQNAEIFFYIGDKAKAEQKCTNNGVDLKRITIGDHPKEISSFINRKLNIS